MTPSHETAIRHLRKFGSDDPQSTANTLGANKKSTHDVFKRLLSAGFLQVVGVRARKSGRAATIYALPQSTRCPVRCAK